MLRNANNLQKLFQSGAILSTITPVVKLFQDDSYGTLKWLLELPRAEDIAAKNRDYEIAGNFNMLKVRKED